MPPYVVQVPIFGTDPDFLPEFEGDSHVFGFGQMAESGKVRYLLFSDMGHLFDCISEFDRSLTREVDKVTIAFLPPNTQHFFPFFEKPFFINPDDGSHNPLYQIGEILLFPRLKLSESR